MPAVTYFTENQLEKMRSVPTDKDLDELLQELREVSKKDWVIGTREEYIRHWFKDTEVCYHYRLYVGVGGIEYQIINLRNSQGGSVFKSTAEDKEHITNYILGYLAGCKRA